LYLFNTDIVDWVIGCLVDWLSSYKYGFIPYLQNNWTLALRFQVFRRGSVVKKARARLKPCMKLRQNGTVFLMIKLAASMAGPY
jgi:hypothetical protein